MEHVLVFLGFNHRSSFFLELFVCILNRLDRFALRLRWYCNFDRAFILKFCDKLFSPFLRRTCLLALDIITMSVRKGIKAKCFVEVALDLRVHILLSNSLFGIFSALLLQAQFFVICDLVEFLKLLRSHRILKSFLIKLVHTVFGTLQSTSF